MAHRATLTARERLFEAANHQVPGRLNAPDNSKLRL
jgi:hypothetical protein